ncbi:MAG: replicative DNA helicase [Firmicutes bacterium]|nr:replicative DNA helicase [Bacillota bacterium]
MDEVAVSNELRIPQSDSAEKAVLGSVLLEPGLLYEVMQILSADDFYKDSHKRIFKVMTTLLDEWKEIDLVTVGDALRINGVLDIIGGLGYLTDLYDAVPTAANVMSYARIVRDKSVKRRLINLAHKISDDAQNDDTPSGIVLDDAENAIYQLSQDTQPTALKQVGEFVAEAYDRIGKEEKGVPTFQALDRYIGGLKKGEMIIVAARPGMGKTTICLNIAERAATIYDKTVAFFTLEMTPVQVASRMLFAKAKVNQEQTKQGKELSDEDFTRLAEAMEDISRSNLYIDDTSMITVAEIRGKIKKLKREKGLDLVVVDYIGLMQPSASQLRESRQQQISEISRQLKSIAKEMEIPVIVISQLNRASVKSEGKVKEPDLSHLRESGALEQDADIVIFVHRPYYYDKSENPFMTKAIVAKNRSGAVGTALLGFMSQYTLFCDMDFDHEEEGPAAEDESAQG